MEWIRLSFQVALIKNLCSNSFISTTHRPPSLSSVPPTSIHATFPSPLPVPQNQKILQFGQCKPSRVSSAVKLVNLRTHAPLKRSIWLGQRYPAWKINITWKNCLYLDICHQNGSILYIFTQFLSSHFPCSN